VKCFGYLPSDPGIKLESRHLGLIPADELSELSHKINRMAELAESCIDIDGMINAAAEDFFSCEKPDFPEELTGSGKGLKIGIAMDRAFSFYYRDNLSLMEEAGIELVSFSPIDDRQLPAGIHGLYLGGGYPEVFASELSANRTMLDDIKEKCLGGMPVYAECGGLIYLTAGVADHDGLFFSMADFFSFRSLMTGRLQRFGYVNLKFDGIDIKAHEFHHSMLEGADVEASYEYSVVKESTGENWTCGLRKLNVLAGYPHIHFYSNPEFLEKIIFLFRGALNDN